MPGSGWGWRCSGCCPSSDSARPELDQHEVAYYFSALALGILGALSTTSVWLSGGLMALIVAVMFLGDHRRLFRHYRHQIMVLDSAVTEHAALVAQLEQLLNARVHNATSSGRHGQRDHSGRRPLLGGPPQPGGRPGSPVPAGARR